MSGLDRRTPFLALVACLACLYPLQRWIDRSPEVAPAEQEALYLSRGENVKRLALGYEALLADVYWIRTAQYFGRKVLNDPTVLDEGSRRLPLLYPLLDVTTTLDPKLIPAYRFGGFFIHDYMDPVQAFTLLEKGIHNNPTNWRLYHDLGFLYWSDGRCEEAARTYERGSKLAEAPPWMAAMPATVLADCGDISLARQMYSHVIESAEDERVRDDARARLMGLQALDEINLLNGAVEAYRSRLGQNPPSLPHLLRAVSLPRGPDVPQIRVNGAGQPLDPNGIPYTYDPATGQISTDPSSVRLPTKIFSRKEQ